VTGDVRHDPRRMDDPRYHAEGWQIGSGPIEAACEAVANRRRKRSGMRRGGDGADAVRHPRASYVGVPGRWDALWERSINR
jgi:hypothetical protein